MSQIDCYLHLGSYISYHIKKDYEANCYIHICYVNVRQFYDVVFEPTFDGYEEIEGYTPYDRDVIPSEGDTCWFYQDLQRVIVKAFDPSEAVKAFKWEMHIYDGFCNVNFHLSVA